MKPFLFLILLTTAAAATAQTARQSTTSMTINDNGKTLSVQVDGQIDGRSVEYRRTFDVARLSDRAKDDLKHRIFDSLGIGEPAAPPRPLAPPAPPVPAGGGVFYTSDLNDAHPGDPDEAEEQTITLRCETCTGKSKLVITRSTDDYSVERDTKADSRKRLFPYQLPLPAGEYRLKYFQDDVLQSQSTFTVTPGQERTVVIQ